jgi:hypothetical protein
VAVRDAVGALIAFSARRHRGARIASHGSWKVDRDEADHVTTICSCDRGQIGDDEPAARSIGRWTACG